MLGGGVVDDVLYYLGVWGWGSRRTGKFGPDHWGSPCLVLVMVMSLIQKICRTARIFTYQSMLIVYQYFEQNVCIVYQSVNSLPLEVFTLIQIMNLKSLIRVMAMT